MAFQETAVENIVGKGQNAGNQHLLVFHNAFDPCKDLW